MKVRQNKMKFYSYYIDLLKENHLLIAGKAGSGKSTLLNGLVCACISSEINGALIICDPKKIDYSIYRNNSHVIAYADNKDDILSTLQRVNNIMMKRYQIMQDNQLRRYRDGDIYVVIDEYNNLILDRSYKKAFESIVSNLTLLGRAAGIHVILATQRCTSDVLNKQITTNISAFIGLHTATAQDSRNIVGVSGCENLPKYGKCIIAADSYDDIKTAPVMFYQDQEIIDFISK